MRLGSVTLAAAIALAGCVTPGGQLESAAEPAAIPALAEVRVLGAPAREPAIERHPDGTLFVASYGGPGSNSVLSAQLHRSDDGGATWSVVDEGDLASGAVGNSDTDLAIAPDGTLYHATMQWLPWGHAISVGATRDKGESWTWPALMVAPWVDRPWVEVGPDGVAHATWSSPLGLHHASSRDRGETWTEGPRVHPSAGSGGLAVGPHGELAVRTFPLRGPTSLFVAFAFLFVDPSVDGVAVSSDGGATWTSRALPGNRTYPDALGRGGDAPRWSDPVAFDAAGTLYAAWGEGDALQLAVSRDLGASWDVRPLWREEGRLAFFPFIRAGAPGELAATWYSYAEGDLLGHVARATLADTDAPLVVVSAAQPATDEDTAGEYFQAMLLSDGSVAAAMPIATGEPATSGFAYLVHRAIT